MKLRADIKFVGLLWLCTVFLVACNATGLNNSTKAFTDPSNLAWEDWEDRSELERTWQAAIVRIPKGDGSYIATQMKDLAKNSTLFGKQHPTVIYLHGCSGVWENTHQRLNFFAENGFAVIAPVSFARKKYHQSCNTRTNNGGMYSGTLHMRQLDAGYAIEMAKNLSWVDSDNVFLMGHSEGGITTAAFIAANMKQTVNARVIEGWTCHHGRSRYRGIKAPKSEPTLALVGSDDPWFQSSRSKGHCGSYLDRSNGSQSIVYREGYLSKEHQLMTDPTVRMAIIKFLKDHLKRPSE